MTIALKRGLNFILNGKSHTTEEIFGLYRKTINTMLLIIVFLIFIALPLAFYAGFKMNTKTPEIRVIDVSRMPKGDAIDSDSIIRECDAKPQCVLNKFKAFDGYDNLSLERVKSFINSYDSE